MPVRLFLGGRYRFLPWLYYQLALFTDLHSFVSSSVSPTVIDWLVDWVVDGLMGWFYWSEQTQLITMGNPKQLISYYLSLPDRHRCSLPRYAPLACLSCGCSERCPCWRSSSSPSSSSSSSSSSCWSLRPDVNRCGRFGSNDLESIAWLNLRSLLQFFKLFADRNMIQFGRVISFTPQFSACWSSWESSQFERQALQFDKSIDPSAWSQLRSHHLFCFGYWLKQSPHRLMSPACGSLLIT